MTLPSPARTGPWSLEDLQAMTTQGFQAHLGVVLISANKSEVVGQVTLGPEHVNSVGSLHGGVIMSLADCLGAMGALLNLKKGQRTATLESKTNFLRPATGCKLTCTSRPLHTGKKTSVWSSEIRDEEGRLAASVTQTQLHF
jgi:uncharacterized protein (TIGR00369 family)